MVRHLTVRNFSTATVQVVEGEEPEAMRSYMARSHKICALTWRGARSYAHLQGEEPEDMRTHMERSL